MRRTAGQQGVKADGERFGFVGEKRDVFNMDVPVLTLFPLTPFSFRQFASGQRLRFSFVLVELIQFIVFQDTYNFCCRDFES
jgi:hypothetical protein